MQILTEILPEQPVPNFITAEQQVLLKEHTKARLIWGEGNPAAPLFVVLDNPGARETKEGEPFLCGTRQTLQTAFFEAEIDLADVYVTFLLKARPLGKYDKDKARKYSLDFLVKQAASHQPKVVVCLGNVVVQSYFGEPDSSVKELRGQRRIINGFPTFVSYHPLAVRRRPVLYKYFLEDWKSVSLALLQVKNSFN